MVEHHPDCAMISFRDLAKECGETAPAGDGWYDAGGLMQCVEGCPHLAWGRREAVEIVKARGWF